MIRPDVFVIRVPPAECELLEAFCKRLGIDFQALPHRSKIERYYQMQATPGKAYELGFAFGAAVIASNQAYQQGMRDASDGPKTV